MRKAIRHRHPGSLEAGCVDSICGPLVFIQAIKSVKISTASSRSARARRLYLDRVPIRDAPSWPEDAAYLVTTDDADLPSAYNVRTPKSWARGLNRFPPATCRC
jgi:hypothetical protein